ncbi:MAG: hypothetical protein GKR97_19980 [Rhizobiaceae bacterium]|nr:hypothetical protein [Rhizobiaceae bacterium]
MFKPDFRNNWGAELRPGQQWIESIILMNVKRFAFSLALTTGFIFMHPIETTSLLTLDDAPIQAASAKGKGSGGGNNGNAGNSSKGKSSLARSTKSNNGRGKNGANRGNDKVKGFFDKLFSKSNNPTTSTRGKTIRPAKNTHQTKLANLKNIAVPKTRPLSIVDPRHPRNLRKLNGALNSNPRAKLAHILNENFNGPVGLAAALALISNAPSEMDIADAEILVGNGVDNGQADIDALAVLDLQALVEKAQTALNDRKLDEKDAAELLAILEESLPGSDEILQALAERAQKEAAETAEADSDDPVVEETGDASGTL